MRNLQQPLSDYERASILTDEVRRRAQAWVQNAASEGGPPIIPNVEPSTFPYGHPGFWAKITGQGKNTGEYEHGGQNNQPDNRGEYEWVLMLRVQKTDDATGAAVVQWQPMDGETAVPPDPDNSINPGSQNVEEPDGPPFPHVGSMTSIEGVILNPVKDANGSRAVPIGSIVWVWPAAQRKFPANATFSASDDYKLSGVNQEYLFAYAESPILRFQLLDDLYACGSARAVRLDMHRADGSSSSDTDPCGLTTQVETIFDRIGIVESSVLARTRLDDESGERAKYVPAGRLVYVKWFADLQDYEPINFGTCRCGSSSSEESSSSGSSSSGSGSGSGGIISDECWIGITNDLDVIHLQPQSKTEPADCSLSYDVWCGLTFDDAGHVLGKFDVPWGGNNGGTWLYYTTGSVAIDNGSKTVTLSGGTFPAWGALATHLCIIIGGANYRVASRDSNTQLTLTDDWPLANYSGAYEFDGCVWKSPRSKLPPLNPQKI